MDADKEIKNVVKEINGLVQRKRGEERQEEG